MTDIDARDELVLWLHVQIDEDERIAIAAAADPDLSGAGNDWFVYRDGVRVDELPDPDTTDLVATGGTAAMNEHIALHDPTRARNEVEMKRQILALHERSECRGRSGSWVECGDCGKDYPCPTVRALIPSYTDRPGFREEWRS